MNENRSDTHSVTRRFGGVPVSAVCEYLVAAGGTPDENAAGEFYGDGWRAGVATAEPRQVSGLEIEQVDLTISGEREQVDELMKFLMPRIMRGGA